jgi:hypothetical protein
MTPTPPALLQIERVEALGEPAVDQSEQFASLLRFALVTPEAREAYCRAEFPGFCLPLLKPSVFSGDGRDRFFVTIIRKVENENPAGLDG